MVTKLSEVELKQLRDLFGLKEKIYAAIIDNITKLEQISVAIFSIQQAIEIKYNINLSSPKIKLDLEKGEIIEEVIETNDKIIELKDLKK